MVTTPHCQPPNQINRFYRVKLRKLCQMRYGNHYLPDNDDGRAMLSALLCFGLTDESASEDAPWCAAELPALKRKARRLKWRDAGKLISLTFNEWFDAKLWILRPIDKTEAELDAWRKERRKESWSKSQQKARKKKERMLAKAATYPPREAAILEMLLSHKQIIPLTVCDLTRLAKKSEAFRRPGAPTRLKGPQPSDIVRSVRTVVHRVVKRLEAKGVITRRGFVWLNDDRYSVTPEFSTKATATQGLRPKNGHVNTTIDEVLTPSVTPSRPAVGHDQDGVISFGRAATATTDAGGKAVVGLGRRSHVDHLNQARKAA
jgi:hypothetical protein